ncbi:MAG: hypothetical protein ABWX84_02825 [Nocardioides sp.]
MNSIVARRIRTALPTVAAAALLGAAVAAPASAVEPRPPRPVPVTLSPWAEPQPALEGLSLAVYVSLHVDHVIGQVGV